MFEPETDSEEMEEWIIDMCTVCIALYVGHMAVTDISLWLDNVIKQLCVANVTQTMFTFAISKSQSCLQKISFLRNSLNNLEHQWRKAYI